MRARDSEGLSVRTASAGWCACDSSTSSLDSRRCVIVCAVCRRSQTHKPIHHIRTEAMRALHGRSVGARLARALKHVGACCLLEHVRSSRSDACLLRSIDPGARVSKLIASLAQSVASLFSPSPFASLHTSLSLSLSRAHAPLTRSLSCPIAALSCARCMCALPCVLTCSA